ncbi:hypothetical protein DFR49_2318 [Hephaestia caeni]|uniref:LexA DNA binding domain-containing protein n=1 Tax=Hephaestia caeni TaxID=645617 RepID=A0A397PEJ2_9SPHN|nr:hypothetical protein [Hephaestia caeni]RIA44081.1 hypothetical protein DFR49_2318 [Hephaestia caeni]
MTPAELKTLDYVRETIAGLGYAPTLAEIGAQVGISTGAAGRIVGRLADDGKVVRDYYRHRSLRLPEAPDLTTIPTVALRAELGRRGETFDGIATFERRVFGRAVSCAADSCQIEVKRGQLFCRRHWFSLPLSLQQDIKRAFAAKDTGKYQVFVSEARDRIDRAKGADAPRRRL